MPDSNNPFPQPSRQAYAALFFILGTFVVRIARQVWPIFIMAFLRPSENGRFVWLLIIVIGITLSSLILSLLNYFKFHFWIEGQTLVIEKGVLKKTKILVPFERIQTINKEQNLFYQFLKVVKLELDTAGSKGKEASIQAISMENAELLSDYILQYKKEIVVSDESSELESDTKTETPSIANEPAIKNALFSRSILDLFKIGLSQDHFRAVIILFAFAMGKFNDIKDLLGDELNEYLDELSSNAILNSIYVIAGLLLVFFIASFLFSLIRTLVKFYKFSLLETRTGLRTQAGLFTKREQNINYNKLQLFKYGNSLVMRFFGLSWVRISQASSEESAARDSVNLPGCYAAEVQVLKHKIFEEINLPTSLDNKIDPSIVKRRVLFLGVIPALLIGIPLSYFTDFVWWSFLSLAIIPLMYLFIFFYQRNFAYGFSEELLHVKTGGINRKNTICWLYKAQTAEISQTLYQRKHQLADLSIGTAAGSIDLPFIRLKEAQLLQNYILYKVESANQHAI